MENMENVENVEKLEKLENVENVAPKFNMHCFQKMTEKVILLSKNIEA